MYITTGTIITFGSVIGALAVILGLAAKSYKWYLKQNTKDQEIEQLKEEQCIICYGLLSCLDGLKQLGANGNVTVAHEKLEKHINRSAHK